MMLRCMRLEIKSAEQTTTNVAQRTSSDECSPNMMRTREDFVVGFLKTSSYFYIYPKMDKTGFDEVSRDAPTLVTPGS